MDEFDKMAQAMIETEITKAQFDDIVLKAYPKPEKDAKGSVKKWETKVDLLNAIYVGDYNNTISGTKWGAFNALTERLDWYRSGRGGDNESILAAASGFDPVVTAEKNRLMNLVLSA
jgi:hypothetical protein